MNESISKYKFTNIGFSVPNGDGTFNIIQTMIDTPKGNPISDKLLVLPQEVEQVTEAGVIIPETAQEKPSVGTIVKTGKGKKGKSLEFLIGRTVYFGKYSGVYIELDNKGYVVLGQNEVFGYEE